MQNERDINHLLRLNVLHASPTLSDRRVVKRIILPEDGTHDVSPEKAAIYNDDSATDLLIKQGTDVIYPEKPQANLPKSSNRPLPKAA
jgi:hypothetical protein